MTNRFEALEARVLLSGSGLGEEVQPIQEIAPDPLPPLGTIEGRKWADLNGNSEFDPDEAGLGGVTIYLDLNNNRTLDADEPFDVTLHEDPFTDFDEGGLYNIGGLAAGDYIVREVVPNGSVQTFPLSDAASPLESGNHFVRLQPGQIASGLNFGNRPILPTGSIHGVKWQDINGNGERDPNEPGLAGVTIYIDRNNNGVLDSSEQRTVTMEDIPETDFDEAGLYWLQGVGAGEHIVREVVPPNHFQTHPGVTSRVVKSETRALADGTALDYDLTGVSAVQGNATVLAELDLTVIWPDSCGNIISDMTTHTVDGNRIIIDMFGEQVGDVCLQVISPQTETIFIGGLAAQDYKVEATLHELQPDVAGNALFVETLMVDGGISIDRGGHLVVLAPGQSADGIDFGNQPLDPLPASIHGLKWNDRNGNGQRDPNEPGLPGVTVYLDLNNNGVLDSTDRRTVTMEDDPDTAVNESGRYWFDGLEAGRYVVREVVPDGFEQTFPGTLFDPAADLAGTDNSFATVTPTMISAGLVPGEALSLDVSMTIHPFCFRPFNVDVVASDPDVSFQNLTGILLNGCGGDTSTFEVTMAGGNMPQHFELQFIDADFGGVLADIPVWLTVAGQGGAHIVHLLPGQVADDIDFGNRPLAPGSVHGIKWVDLNGNAERDPDEPGLAGVTIYSDLNLNRRLDPGEPRTVTMQDDPNTRFEETGRYWLELAPGEHFIREVVPDGYEQTFPGTFMVFESADPNALSFVPDGSHFVIVESGRAIDGIDFGNEPIRPGSIHGTKWVDRNGNAQRDPDEPGLPGVTIYADLNFNGQLDADEPHTVTMEDIPETDFDEGGMYWLQGLNPGTYWITEVVPDGFIQTFPLPLPILDPITNPGTNPDVIAPLPFPVRVHIVTLTSGDTVEGIDFGNQPIEPGSIHGLKWVDQNGNAQRDSDEPGLPGVTIYADLNANGVLDDDEPHTVTMQDDPDTNVNEAGRYWLEGLEPGNYLIREVVPDGFVQTFPIGPIPLPGDSASDLLIFPHPGPGAHFVTLGSGQTVEGIDFGNQPIRPGSVHGTKWVDRNGNAKRDPDEPGLPGVTIYADLNFNGQLDEGEPHTVTMQDIPETDFDEAGMYWLEGLAPGSYAIAEVVPDGFLQTFPLPLPILDPITDPGTNPDVIAPFPFPDQVHFVTLASGETIEGLDFGNKPLGRGSIHGIKWLDENGNAQRDADEPGLAGVTIYADLNANGVLDNNEPHTVSMQDDPDTNANETGRYWLENLVPGDYIIREVVPDGFIQTFPIGPIPPADGSTPGDVLIFPTPGAHFVSLAGGQTVEGIDFGNQPIRPGSIHGIKWVDRNGNAVRDPDEPGLPGVTIYADLNNNGVLDQGEPRAVTMENDPTSFIDESGMYWLENLDPGNYFIREVVPDGFVQTFPHPNIWFDPATGLPGDPDVRPIVFPVGAHFVILGSGQRVEGIDFGNQPIRPGSIHGTKWEDRNGNGQRDADEPGLAGVTIYVDLNSNGVLDDNEPHTVTMEDIPETDFDEGGMYWLEGLEPGTYVVREVVPDGFVQTFPILPIPLVEDGVPTVLPFPFPGGAHIVTLNSGDVVEGIDFGNQRVEPGSVRGVKWLDSNSDGRRNDDELGFPGVVIYSDLNFNGRLDPHEPRTETLRDDPNTDFDESGLYWLEGLRPGFHAIREVVPKGFVQTFPRPNFPFPIPADASGLTIFIPPGAHLVSVPSGGTVEGLNFGNRLAGDANFDGKVTGLDIIKVQQNFGRTLQTVADSPPLFGDANGDGMVTGADILSVIKHYGNTESNQGGPVDDGTHLARATAAAVMSGRTAAVPTGRSYSAGLLDADGEDDPVDILALLDPEEN